MKRSRQLTIWLTLQNISGLHGIQYALSAGIGTGILKNFAPAPTPPSQLFLPVVHKDLVDGHSAAQNIYPSIPEDAPESGDITRVTYSRFRYWIDE